MSYSVRTTDSAAAQQALNRRQGDSRAPASGAADLGAQAPSFEAMMARHLKSARVKLMPKEAESDSATAAANGQGAMAQATPQPQHQASMGTDVPGALLQGTAQPQANPSQPAQGDKEEASGNEASAPVGQARTATHAARRGGHPLTRMSGEQGQGAAQDARRGARADEAVLDAGKDGKPGAVRGKTAAEPADASPALQKATEMTDSATTTAAAPRMDTHGLEADRNRSTSALAGTALLQSATPAPASNAPAAATPVVQVQVAAPVHDPDFVQQFSSQVSILTQQGITHAELSINPPNMGPVMIEIRHQDNQVQVDFRAEMRETRQAIESSLGQLRDLLQEQGVELQDSWVRAMTAAPVQDSAQSQATGSDAGSRAAQGDASRAGQGSAGGRDGAQAGGGGSAGRQGPRTLSGGDVLEGSMAAADERRAQMRPAAGLSLFA